MKERPIIFSEPMVRAILAGRKTQTRREVTVQPVARPDLSPSGRLAWLVGAGTYMFSDKPTQEFLKRCRYGQPGDRLWVRETWRAFFDDEVPADRPRGPRHTMGQPSQPDRKSSVFYRADGPGPVHPDGVQPCWFSPLHLPRKYSRITLEIVSVRVERLQDISHADAMAEGMALDDAIYDYSRLWESLYGAGSWDANPWVWVIEFERVEGGAK